jgi:lipopolysaccharide/colanic/teichoic acid biosynthesis glycosyltransferase
VTDYREFILLLIPVFLAIFLFQGLYEPQNLLGGTQEYAAVVRACSYGLVATVLIGFAVRQPVSRTWPVLSWCFATGLVGAERFAMRRFAYRLRRRGYFTRRTIVVGADADSVALAKQLHDDGSGIRIVGFLDAYQPAGAVLADGLRILGPPTALRQVAARTGAHEAIIVPQALPWETVQALITEAAAAPNGLRIHLSPGFYELLVTKVRLLEWNRVPLLAVTRVTLTPFEAAFKRTLDCVLGAALLIAFTPVLAYCTAWLRAHGSRGVLESRQVAGRHGKTFAQLAFNGRLNSDFIRKLPGLINVLAGQLSLIGPRPRRVDEPGARESPHSLTIRPGLTGPWRQVSDLDEQAILDLYYIRSYSIWLDLQVLYARLKAHIHRPKPPNPMIIDARVAEHAAR